MGGGDGFTVAVRRGTDEAEDKCVRDEVWDMVLLSWRVMNGCETE